jgi:putative transposase
MKKSRFSETQIVSILKQADAGVPIKDICRQAGISTPTYYKWKSKYGGLEASGLKRVKELEAENTQRVGWAELREAQQFGTARRRVGFRCAQLNLRTEKIKKPMTMTLFASR